MDFPFIWYKNLGGTFVRFVTIHAYDGQTDGQTNGQSDRHLCRRKDRPACMQPSKNGEDILLGFQTTAAHIRALLSDKAKIALFDPLYKLGEVQGRSVGQ